jgi:phosphatidylserine/phosphatidylglycerophosphate/cardiolipin synthase-like enzyme
MGIPRDLVSLEETLHSNKKIDLFAPIERGGILDSPEANAMLPRIRETDLRDPAQVLRLCLQALRIQHDELEPNIVEAELVATLPPEMPGVARPTGQVIREMLRSHVREVILLGYELSDPDMMQLLVEVTSWGADLIMICDRMRGSVPRLLEAWPAGIQRPRIFQDRARPDGAPYASMHAKCLLVDGKDLLITSANFTFHGLHGNIEIGVRLSGPPVIEARKIFSHLVETGIVEEIH